MREKPSPRRRSAIGSVVAVLMLIVMAVASAVITHGIVMSYLSVHQSSTSTTFDSIIVVEAGDAIPSTYNFKIFWNGWPGYQKLGMDNGTIKGEHCLIISYHPNQIVRFQAYYPESRTLGSILYTSPVNNTDEPKVSWFSRGAASGFLLAYENSTSSPTEIWGFIYFSNATYYNGSTYSSSPVKPRRLVNDGVNGYALWIPFEQKLLLGYNYDTSGGSGKLGFTWLDLRLNKVGEDLTGIQTYYPSYPPLIHLATDGSNTVMAVYTATSSYKPHAMLYTKGSGWSASIQIGDTPASHGAVEVAYGNGVYLASWADGKAAYCSIYNISSGTWSKNILLKSVSSPYQIHYARACWVSTYFIILYKLRDTAASKTLLGYLVVDAKGNVMDDFTYQSAQEEQFDIIGSPVYYPPTSSIYGLAVRPIGGDKGVIVEYRPAQLTVYIRNLGERSAKLQGVYVKDVETNTGIICTYQASSTVIGPKHVIKIEAKGWSIRPGKAYIVKVVTSEGVISQTIASR